jgi:hypothetical protein
MNKKLRTITTFFEKLMSGLKKAGVSPPGTVFIDYFSRAFP